MTADAPLRPTAVTRRDWVLFGVFTVVAMGSVALTVAVAPAGYTIALAVFAMLMAGSLVGSFRRDQASRIATATIDGTPVVAVETPDIDGLRSAAELIQRLRAAVR